MRAVVTRVKEAAVEIEGKITGKIESLDIERQIE